MDDPSPCANSESPLPLQLIKSETIPPSPGSSIDCLLNYSNFSWIAYGASSLLVISHIPSPTSPQPQTLIAPPIYRQVIQLPSSSPIKSLSWSPSIPSSNAEIAAAVDNLICLYADFSSGAAGSFDWTQVAVLLQCHTIHALQWTNSGDGIVTVGVEVVLWKRKDFHTWELAWKLKPNHPQTMVTATWSTQGPVASSSSSSTDANTCVLVCQMDDKSEFIRRSDLRHPQPVLTVQWRPSSSSHRDVLLTCCVDGTARLWVEIDTGRAKNSKQYYHVVAVIEINHTLNGTLGVNTFVTWVTEMTTTTTTTTLGGRAKREGSAHVMPGACEWLIGYGPHMMLTFWAVHCLDDTSPLRFPRVTLWKTLDMAGEEGRYLQRPGNFNSKDHSVFIKAVVSRNQLHGPPAMCSLLQLLSDNSIGWSYLPTLESSNTLGDSFSLDGHSANILQVDIHPYSCEVELAVSLDSNGLLLFWSFSTFSSSTIGMPARLLPNWKLVGKMETKQLYCVEYSSLRWAPSVSNGQCVLLLGHPTGIDCFIIEIAKTQAENIACHKLCTIPFTGHKHADAPTSIYASPLPCTCRKSFISNRFMLLGVWTSKFQAFSWRVTLHSADSPESCCDCNFDVRGDAAGLDGCRYESSFAGRRYCLVTEPCSSMLPDSPIFDQITSVAAVPPGGLMPSVQRNWPTSNGVPCKAAPFQLATGHSDGSLRLWRSSCSKSLTPCSEPWELVGMLHAHQEKIAAISLSCSGGKIATVSFKNCQEDVTVLCIWKPIHIMDVGSFLLEDQICLNGVVVAMNWFSIGNGELLLGVCMKNELRIYAQKSCRSPTLVDSGEPLVTHIWCCIATNTTSITALDFIWGPGATPVLLHEKYFSLFSKWSFHMDKKYQSSFCAQLYEENGSNCIGETDKEFFATVFSDCSSCKINNLSSNWITKRYNSDMPSKLSAKSDHPVDNLFSTTGEPQYTSGKCFRSILEVAGEIRRSLPIYHPEALLLNLFSGNWRRACVALRHLVGHLTSNNTSVLSGKTHDHVPNKGIPQILLSKYYDEPYSVAVGNEELTWGVGTASVSSLRFQQNSINSFGYNEDDNGPNNRVTPGSGKSEIIGFIETIEKCTDIPSITSLERRQMLAVMDILLEIGDSSCASAYESLDEPARRFWVELKFQQHFLRRFGGLEATNVLVVGSVMIGWAFLSDCQDNLITSVLPNEPSWQDMRNLGAGFWFRNTTQLRTRMEKLARSQYLKKRDPKDCALLYIALNRLQVLAGLFKVSRDEKDKPLVGFLSRNFQDEKNKAAALKNAYVLMGRHQLELAIAFFLLGGDTSSAVSVCAKTLGDEQLALVICRLMEGNGGPLERHLITTILLPASIDRGDCWLASLFEWTLGNYFPSLLRLLGHTMDGMDLGVDWSVLLSCRSAFLDPKIGQYCLVLATTPFMKNYIGESAAGLLTRWATLMTSTALHRRGMPVEALQSLSFSLVSIEIKDDGISTDLERHGIPHRILTHNNASNWLSGDVSLHVESNFKLDLALHNISYMVVEHPIWIDITLSSLKPLVCNKYTSSQYKISLVNFQHKLNSELTTFEQKYSLDFLEMLNMILVYSCNHGLSFIGYHMLHGYTSPEFSRDEDCSVDSIFQYLSLPELFLRASEEVLCFLTRYLICCSVIYPPPHSSFPIPKRSNANRSCQLYLWDVYMKRSLQLLESLRAILKMYYPSFLSEDLMTETCSCIDLVEYYLVFTSAWRHKNLRRLILIIQPLLVAYNDGHIPWKVGVENLKKHLCENLVLLTCDSSIDDVEETPMLICKQGGDEISAALLESIPDDEKWLILGTCLWRHLFNFTRDMVKSYPDNLTTCSSSKSLLGAIFSSTDGNESCDSGKKCTNDGFMQAPLLFVNSLNNALATIASSHERQLASVLGLKLELGVYVPSLVWLDNTSHSHASSSSRFLKQDVGSLMSKEEEFFRVLWEISVDPKEVCKFLPQDNMSRKLSKGWTDLRKGSWNKLERDDTLNEVQGANGEGVGRYPPDNGVFLKSRSNNSTIVKDVTLFQNPEEIYKRNGELLEVICLNSINQQQAAVASNRKGILFFNWKEEELSNEHSEYIWSVADWPQNGWAGSESTPVATFVSQGIGLGSNKGTHLGLGGATVGMGEGAFGSSELGWGTQEDFEFDDPPATVDNISTRALCSHPARPLFLAGSSNTHIYLWEFGKDKAVATYGVLPAANVPPPYALASIEALQFDNYGHRFATAALDGTICTWQLEVGGRSNVHPTESSLCFNRHALDVTYVGASGSVIAAAGYSSDDVNVVIWDTLAPPTTSQASLMCHQGGARSVSVFEKNIGSGSISPLIVTGGRGGDIGLHDFRFIATGKSKQQHHKGMLWYIPKAHVGSVTRIAVIPDSSFFLTGGKDGDVKLWDANKSQLVFHWPKLHERHTFLQPTSRGFGGIVRAAVTDIQVVSNGFLTCGGDGTVKMVLINNFANT